MNDLISKAKLFNRLATVQTLGEAYAVIQDMPTAERKTGEWIKHSIGEHTPWGFDCSECGEWFVVGEEVIKKYNYCPNCGSHNGEQP